MNAVQPYEAIARHMGRAVIGALTFCIHAPWLADAAGFRNELNHVLKNLAILGALLFLAAPPPATRAA